MKFNHKSLGGFDVVITQHEGPFVKGQKRPIVTRKHRVMVTIDAWALALTLGHKAINNKSKQTKLCGGAIQIVDLGGVVL